MYPSDYEFDLVLRTGEVGRFRPIKPSDAADLVDFFDRLGVESRYFRFFRAKARLTDEEVEYFTNVDYQSRMAFVVYLDEMMVGVGRYDAQEVGTAETAFAVADDHQGKGIGTQLLQLMTAYARSHGVEQFRAFVLPDNLQMMRVFRNSGYELHRTLEEGVYNVDFPVALSEDARSASDRREQMAIAASILPIFFPRAIAVVGASRDDASIGGRLLRNLMAAGFGGTVYPINPKAKHVQGLTAYPTIGDVPGPVDLAIIAVPARYVLDVARQCGEQRVRGLVVISAGFSEVGGEGEAREQELLNVVRNAGMRMVGPNCMGVLNTDPAVSLNATFAPRFPPRGNIAMSSQSGALGIAILDYARRNNIGISSFVSVGNKADVSGNDLLLSWEDDPATDVIVLYLESFGNPRRFSRIARRIAAKKPILAVKSGRTSAGSRAASSHTGALASTDVAVDALFRQTGVIRTDTLEELFDIASLLASQPLPAGRRVAVVTNAGGPGILAADAIEAAGLELPEFSKTLQDALAEGLPAEAAIRNPVDLIASAGPAQYAHALGCIGESDEVDSVIGIYIPTTESGADDIAEEVMKVSRRFAGQKTMAAVVMEAGGTAASLSDDRLTIPVYQFPEDAARAVAKATDYAEWRARPQGEFPTFPDFDLDALRSTVDAALTRLEGGEGWLEAAEVERLLAAAGLRVPRSVVATGEDAAVAGAAQIGTAVAMKVISDDALHKSDVGGVVLDVEGEEAVRAAYRQVTDAVGVAEGVLVQEMIGGDHEVLVGMTEDPSFGSLLVFGLGGVFVELLGDVTFRINPITDLEAEEMISEVKASRLLAGYRNVPAGDVDATREALLRVSRLVEAVPEMTEMDLNPVKVLAPGEGVVVVDARIRIRPVAEGWSPELADIPSLAGSPRSIVESAGDRS